MLAETENNRFPLVEAGWLAASGGGAAADC